VFLTEEDKSDKEIAARDFDSNLELVSVWIDYMVGINWIPKDDGKWVARDDG
jgi:hypothetical protein